MIRSIEITAPEKVAFIPWLKDVPALAQPRKFEFKPGINVLWGKNGSGKTTLLKVLAKVFHCEQSGFPIVTETSIRALFDHSFHEEKDPGEGLKLNHDGQGVRHFDPSNKVGIIGGSFDDDFFAAGVANTVFKGSAGETTMRRSNNLIGSILERTVPKVEYRITEKVVNDLWGNRIKLAKKLLKGTGENGPPTVLLDEPERSFDIPSQVAIWRLVRAFAPTVQFIVASHTFFALNLAEAHFIPMQEDGAYLDSSRKCFKMLSTTWNDEKPLPPPPKPSESKRSKKK